MALLSDADLGIGTSAAPAAPKLSTRDKALQGAATGDFSDDTAFNKSAENLAMIQDQIREYKNEPKKLAIIKASFEEEQRRPMTKGPTLLSDADLGIGLPKTDREQKIGQVRSLLGNKEKFASSTTATGKEVLGNVAALADMFAGLGGMALDIGAYAAARTIGGIAGQPSAEGAASAKGIATDLIPDAMAAPFHRIMTALGHEDTYNESTVAKAMNFIGKGIEKGSGWMAQQTGEKIRPEDYEYLTKSLMLVFGTKGGDVAFKKAMIEKANKQFAEPTSTIDLERIEAEKFAKQQAGMPASIVNPGGATTVAKAAAAGAVGDPATGSAHAWLAPVDVELPKEKAHKSIILDADGKPIIVKPKKAGEQAPSQFGTAGEAPALAGAAFRDPKTGDIIKSAQKHDEMLKESRPELEQGFLDSKGTFLNRQEAAARAKETGQLEPGDPMFKPEEGLHSGDIWRKGATAAAVGAGATYLITNPEDIKKFGGMPALLAAGAVMGADRSGVWTKGAVERLAKSFGPDIIGPSEADVAAGQAWATRAITKHLNKHFGAETDPLNSVKIPMLGDDVTWGEVADNVVKSAKIPVRLEMIKKGEAMKGEAIWDVEDKSFDELWNAGQRGSHLDALTSYLSHVGDYLREFVPPEKLQNYDLVRAVRETAAQDAKQAAKMEKARASGEGTVPYKTYPDGMKWVEVQSEDALKNEGDVMGHCVGGYCEAVHNGESKIYSLRDAKGMSHVTVEVQPKDPARVNAADYRGQDSILQIKGKQNRAPVAQYLPYVQDFVKSGKWGEVGDLENASLVNVRNPRLGQRGPMDWTPELAQQAEAKFGRYADPVEFRKFTEAFEDQKFFKGPNIVNLGLGIDAVQWAKDNPKLAAAVAAGAAGATIAAATDPKHPLGLAALGAAAGFGLVRLGPPLWEAVRGQTPNASYSQSLADSLYKLTKQSQANQIGMLQWIKDIPKEYSKHAELIYHSLEDPSVKLSPEAQAIKAKYVEPLMKQNEILREALRKEGIDVGSDVDSYVHRITKGRPSIFEEMDKQLPRGKTLSQFASALKERKVFSITEPNFGTKIFMVMNEKGTGYKAYQNGKVVGTGKATPAELAAGDIKLGNTMWKKGPATTVEIEANTPIQYHHDALASAIGSNTRLTQVYNNVKYLKDLKKDPAFAKVATQDLATAPADWREVPDIPQLRGWKFEPRVANVLEDFSGAGGSTLTQNMGKISRYLTGSLFWNPLPHIFNILDHAIVQRGLMSGWANPATYPRLMRTSLEAWKAVTDKDATYARFVKEGAGLMYPNVLVQDFSAKVLKQLGTDERMGPVAKAWGYVNPVEMVKAIYRSSRDSLWKWNDIIMMQAYLEKESIKGGSASVIKNVEKHIPNYRIPDQVMGSRQISEFMRSPIALAFGRYDYGRMASYGNMVKELVGKDKTIGDRAKALDQMAMVGFMGLVVYPLLMDNVAKALTGNQNATVQRFGASTVPYLAYEYLYKDKSLVEVANSMYPAGMLLNAAVSLRNNRDMFSGKHLIEEPADLAAFAARQLQPLYVGERLAAGKQTAGQFALQAVGIKSPTTEQVERKEAFRQREKAAQRRRWEKSHQ